MEPRQRLAGPATLPGGQKWKASAAGRIRNRPGDAPFPIHDEQPAVPRTIGAVIGAACITSEGLRI